MLKIEISKVIEYLEKYKQELVEDYYLKKDKTDKHYFMLYAIGVVDYLIEHFEEMCKKEYKLLWYIDENKKHHHIIFSTKEEMIGFIKEENLFLDELKQINKEDNVWCCFDFKELNNNAENKG